MIRAVCFGLDNTLFDSRQVTRAGLRAAATLVESETGEEVAGELSRAYDDEDDERRAFQSVLDTHGLSVDVGRLVDAFHSHTDSLDPYPAAPRVLAELDSRYELGLSTTRRDGDAKLDALGLTDVFDVVVVPDDWERERESFERILEALRTRPQATVHVSAEPDAAFSTANELGMHTVRIGRNRLDECETRDHDADHHVLSLREIPDVVRSLDN